tara:strand:- start:151 stop:945 length:795 start_codon:yes stop_codon:yes gene_type:complete
MTNDKPEYNPNNRIPPLGFDGGCSNVRDVEKFREAVALLKESLFDGGSTMFCSDNLITWNKNLSFLRDDRLVNIVNDPETDVTERSIIWRTYILFYFARTSLDVEGDFIEAGIYRGHTAEQMLKECELSKHEKKLWLYDIFEWKEGDEHPKMDEHRNALMYEDVVSRFSKYSNVNIVKGSVPESFSEGFPDSIAFCHIDMNHSTPEAGALREVLPRLSKGGAIIFDDYGWWGYSAQKVALDPIARSFGQEILELPTGQGLLIKK